MKQMTCNLGTFDFSDRAWLHLSLRKDPSYSQLFRPGGWGECMQHMHSLYWEARLVPENSTIRLDDNHGNTSTTILEPGASVRDLVTLIHAYYHQPAPQEYMVLHESTWVEDKTNVRVTDLMEGYVMSHGMMKAEDDVYELDLYTC